MSVMVSIAWRNLWRQGRRTLITAVAMGIGVAMCMAMYTFTDGMMGTMFGVLVDQKLGHVQVHHPNYPARRALHDTMGDIDTRLASLDPLDAEVVTVRLFGFGLLSSGDQTEGGQVMGVEPTREAAFGRVDESMVEGRYLQTDAAAEAVVGVGLAKKLKLVVGSELVAVTQAADGSLGNALFEVVGVFRSGDSMLDRGGALVHIHDLQEMLVLPDQAHEVVMLAPDQRGIDALTEQVKTALGESDDILVRTWYEASPMTQKMMGAVEGQMAISIFIILGLASFGVLNTMLMAVFERTHELGVLMAVGMRPRRVVQLVVIESVLLGLMASAAGLVMGAALDIYLVVYGIDFSVDGKGLDFMGVAFDPVMRGEFRLERVFIVLSLVMVVSVLAALWPAFRASRLQPVQAIRAD
jgi:ABC-type lipoprotein release transport system permease subunit